jgi:pSer/pThr/pTyr-binding forkhead associated (FHA) protein
MSESQFGDETARFSDDLVPPDTAGLSPEEAQAIAALPSRSALLVVLRGPSAGSRFLLDQDVTLAGRHPNADIFLDDVTVSRRHAEFHREGQTFFVKDLGSMNGTYRAGESIVESKLEHGDEIQVGKFRLTFFAADSDRGAL